MSQLVHKHKSHTVTLIPARYCQNHPLYIISRFPVIYITYRLAYIFDRYLFAPLCAKHCELNLKLKLMCYPELIPYNYLQYTLGPHPEHTITWVTLCCFIPLSKGFFIYLSFTVHLCHLCPVIFWLVWDSLQGPHSPRSPCGSLEIVFLLFPIHTTRIHPY